jgi:preprotein translocase SecE subunit
LQLGVQKYLYTGYFVGGFLVAFVVHHSIDRLWEGHDAIATLAGGAAGVLATIFAWKNTRIRTLAREIIDELAAVTWPTREETQTATLVVMATSIMAAGAIFFLDRFWGKLTEFLFR